MQLQVMLDKLSEFLMVEQGGWKLYRVAASRCPDATIRAKYEEFGRQTAQHREVFVRLIQQLGGDPNYVSPVARVAQLKATSLLESSVVAAGLSPQEIMCNDLENVFIAESKCHQDWELLSQLVEQVSDPKMKQALQQAVAEVEDQEDQHLEWAQKTLAQLSLQMVLQGPAPSPERWQQVISGPVPPIEAINPSPVTEGLLKLAQAPMWQESLVARSMKVS